MIINKRDFPLSIVRIIEKLFNNRKNEFVFTKSGQGLLTIKEKIDNSVFFFRIKEITHVPNDIHVSVMIKPTNENNTATAVSKYKLDNLERVISNWISVLDKYNEIKFDFNDPVIKQFSDEYFSEFKNLDDDADTNTYSLNQILILDQFLDKIEESAEKYLLPDQPNILTEVKEDIKELRDNLTTKPKNCILKSFTIIWAKLSKYSLNFARNFNDTGQKEITKRVINGLIDKVIDCII